MMTKITETEFLKISEVTGVSHFDLQKLYAMGLLRESMLIDTLIRYDYNKVKSMGKYRIAQIITRLVDKYHVSRPKIKDALYHKVNRYYYCNECGVQVGKSVFKRNDGLCDNCVAKSIEL